MRNIHMHHGNAAHTLKKDDGKTWR